MRLLDIILFKQILFDEIIITKFCAKAKRKFSSTLDRVALLIEAI